MASLSINYMREKVAELYSGTGWKERVMRYMPDRQVIAVYHYALEHNKFDETKKEEGVYHQMNLTEYMTNKQ